MERERGYCLCKKPDGKLAKGKEGIGDTFRVSFPMDCPSNSKLHSTFHTHPSGDLRPSKADIKVMDRFKVNICIGDGKGRIQCYRRKLSQRK